MNVHHFVRIERGGGHSVMTAGNLGDVLGHAWRGDEHPVIPHWRGSFEYVCAIAAGEAAFDPACALDALRHWFGPHHECECRGCQSIDWELGGRIHHELVRERATVNLYRVESGVETVEGGIRIIDPGDGWRACPGQQAAIHRDRAELVARVPVPASCSNWCEVALQDLEVAAHQAIAA